MSILLRSGERAFLGAARCAAIVTAVLILGAAAAPLGAQQPATAGPGAILGLYSYGRETFANSQFDRGFRLVLEAAGPGAPDFFTEYLETDGRAQTRVSRDYLRQKYARRRIGVLVAESDAALAFLLEVREKLFPGVPIVYWALVPPSVQPGRTASEATGVIAAGAYKETLDVARRLQPGISHAFVIFGTPAANAPQIAAGIQAELEEQHRDLTITYLINRPTEELMKTLARVPERSVVLYIHQSDGAKVRALRPLDTLALIARASPVPVYGVATSYVGHGVVGGYMWDSEAIGTQVGLMALRAAGGAAPRDIPIERAALTPVFDWRELQRRGIREDRLPPDSIVRFARVSLWRQYRPYGLAGLAVALMLSALIGRLWLENRGRRRAERNARRYLATMAHLERRAEVGQLTASLAHELNQPLGAILRNSEAAGMLLRSGRPPLADLREIVDDIRKDDRRAAEIIRRLRTLLQKRELSEEPVDLNDVTRETVAFVAPDAASRGVHLELSVSETPSMVNGDRVHLQQVLLNLVSNALDAMALTPSEHRRLVVTTTAHRRHAEVSVQDNGSGFPEGTTEQLFEPFFTTKKDGMGVGLSIARSIVEAHRGRIVVENNRGAGATVRFSLPLRRRGKDGTHAKYESRIH